VQVAGGVQGDFLAVVSPVEFDAIQAAELRGVNEELPSREIHPEGPVDIQLKYV